MQLSRWLVRFCLVLILFELFELHARAADYHVGPGQMLVNISDVSWATLLPGDRVFIHWRATPYQEKWVINRQGTANARIEIIGVNGPNGQQPIIDGQGASTAVGLNYWNEQRGVIKIGGSSTPADGLPAYITINNLEIRSARPPFTFNNDQGQEESYVNNAAAIYIEKGAHLIIRNCTLHDSGNGIFIGAFNGQTQDILIEGNYMHNNGNVGSAFEHNAYTAAIGITYQYNRFGPLRSGANGNNLKDRSAGLTVRYNWIEGGNRQLDMVDAEDTDVIVNHPAYGATHVYGNVLIEPDGDGNSQILHYGGDSGETSIYRKGTLYFYQNTVISTRAGNTTLMRLSTNDESAEMFNNAVYVTAGGNRLAMLNSAGTLSIQNNWLNSGWVNAHSPLTGSVLDQGDNLIGTDPGFSDFNSQDFVPDSGSPLLNHGDPIPSHLLPAHDVELEYLPHQSSRARNVNTVLDIGAFELSTILCQDTTHFIGGTWSNGLPDLTNFATIQTNYSTGDFGDLSLCGCRVFPGIILSVLPGDTLEVRHELSIGGQLEVDELSVLSVQQE